MNAIVEQLRTYRRKMEDAANEEAREDVRQDMIRYLDAQMRERLGFTDQQTLQVKALGDDKTKAAVLLSAIMGLGALSQVAQFHEAAKLAHVAVDALAEAAQLARRLDVMLDSVEVNGTGFMLEDPYLLDSVAIAELHRNVDRGTANDSSKQLLTVLEDIATKVGEGHTGRFSPMTLMGLRMLGDKIATSLLPLTMLAGRGYVELAKALLVFNNTMAEAGKEGAQLNEKAGSDLFFSFTGSKQVAVDAMVTALNHVIEHGSSAGFDAEAVATSMRDRLAALGNTRAVRDADECLNSIRRTKRGGIDNFQSTSTL